MDLPWRLLRLRFFANVVGRVACLVAGGGSLKIWAGGGLRGLGARRGLGGAGGEDGVYVGQAHGGHVEQVEHGLGVVVGEEGGEVGADILDAVEIGLGEEVAVPDEEEVGLGQAAECCAGVGEVGAPAGGVFVVGAWGERAHDCREGQQVAVEDVDEQAVEVDEMAADGGGREAHGLGEGGHGEAAGAELGEEGAAGGDDVFVAVLLTRVEARLEAGDFVDAVAEGAGGWFHGGAV